MSEEFEKIKENAEEIKDEIRDGVAEAAEAVEAEVNEAADAVEAEVAEAVEEVKADAEEVKAEVEEAADAAAEKKEEFKQKVDDMAGEVKEAYENVKDKAQDAYENVKDKAQDVFKGAAAAYATAKEKTQSTVEDIKKEIDDYSDEMDPDDVSKNKLMAVLAYIGPLVLLPILCARNSKFARFHANQGLVLFLLGIVCWLLDDVKLIGWIFDICAAVVAILCVVGIIYAVQGKAKELPVVGNWKVLK